MCCYEIVKLDYIMSSSSANGASTIYIINPSRSSSLLSNTSVLTYLYFAQCYCTRKAIIL